MRAPALIAVVSALALGAAVPASGADPAAAAALERARALWHSYGIDDYRYRIRRLCFCPASYIEPGVVVVRDGRPVRFRGVHREVNSVPKLFGQAEEALGDDFSEVRYSPGYGLPKDIARDPSFRIADEEVTYLVRRFRVLD